VTVPTAEELRSAAVGTGYVVAGLTDLALEQARAACARARTSAGRQAPCAVVNAELDLLRRTVAQLPGSAAAVLSGGGVDHGLDELSRRGHEVVARARRRRAVQELARRGRTPLSRTHAAVTTVRRDTALAPRAAG
jgi:hypothetical protein